MVELFSKAGSPEIFKVTNVFSFIYLRFRFACDHFSCNIVCGTTNSKAIVLVIEAQTLLVVLAG